MFFLFVVTVTRAGQAEVLDKVPPPWDPTLLVASLVALVLVSALAATRLKSLQVLALGLALVWAFFRIEMEEWFSEDVGPPLQAELSAGEGKVWLGAILAEAFLPGVAVAAVALLRSRKA